MREELIKFLSEPESFVLKQEADKSITALLFEFQKELSETVKPIFLERGIKINTLPAKVNKGNNHHGFPYQVVDYPALLNRDNALSFRTTVWYGNNFSFSLILSGEKVRLVQLNWKKLAESKANIRFEDIWNSSETKDTQSLSNLNYVGIKENALTSKGFRIFLSYPMNKLPLLKRLGIESFKLFFT